MQQFDQFGNPVQGQFQQQPPVGPPQPAPTVDPTVQALIAQNQQLQAMVLQQANTPQAPAQPALQPPTMPANFNPMDVYDPETESGKWHIANEEYKSKKLLADVGTVFKEEIGQVQQATQFDQKLNAFAAAQGMTPQQALEFKEFLDKPKADMDTLYEVYKTKQQTPIIDPNTGQPQYQSNVPAPTNVMQNQGKQPPQETGPNQLVQNPPGPPLPGPPAQNTPPAPVATVGSPAGGQQPPATFAEMAKNLTGAV
jgi:hypothetical protein